MSMPDLRYASELDPRPSAAASLPRELWRRKGIVLAVLIPTVLVALTLSFVQEKSYTASAEVKVSSGNISDTGSGSNGNTLLATQVQVLQSTQMANDVAQRLGDSVEILEVQVEGIPESQIATVTVQARTAQGAADAANAYVIAYDERRDQGAVQEARRRAQIVQTQVDALSEQLAQLQAEVDAESTRVNLQQARITVARDNAARNGVVLGPEDVVLPNTAQLNALQARYSETASQLANLRQQLQQYQIAEELGDGGAAIVSVASPPSRPDTPGPFQVGVLGILLGLALGVAAALAMALLDRRLHDRDAVNRVVDGVPVLTTLPARQEKPAARVGSLVLPQLRSPQMGEYTVLASQVIAGAERGGHARLLVAGPTDEDAADIAGGLATALACLGKSVVLVDLDTEAYGSVEEGARRRGVTDVLAGDAALLDCLVPYHVPGAGRLSLLPAGRALSDEPVAPDEPLAMLLDSVSRGTEFVVIHGTPLLGPGVSVVALSSVDAVIVPVKLGVTRAPALRQAVERVQALGGRVLGIVLRGPARASGSGSADRSSKKTNRPSGSVPTALDAAGRAR